MRILFVCPLLLTLVTPVAAQTVLPPVTDPLTLTLLAANPIELRLDTTPEIAGDELLFRPSAGWRNVVFIGRWHPTKSGPAGLTAAPGICFEPAMAFSFVPDTITAADVNGDGRDDLIGTAPGQVQAILNAGLQFCR
jgi:hypothetical protein